MAKSTDNKVIRIITIETKDCEFYDCCNAAEYTLDRDGACFDLCEDHKDGIVELFDYLNIDYTEI